MRIVLCALTGLLLAAACGPPQAASLILTAQPLVLSDNVASSRVRIVATAGDGKAGTGTVSLEASAGVLQPESVTLDDYGTALASVSCDLGADAGCAKMIDVLGTWVTGQETVTGSTRANLKPSSTVIPPGPAFADAGCPAFIMQGPDGVINGPLSYDSTNARFSPWNSFVPEYDTDYRGFEPGRGVLVAVEMPPDYNISKTWNVFLFHKPPNQTGTFTVGLYRPANENDGTGTRIMGPGTTCSGFVGDDFFIRSVEYAGGQVTHLSAEIWAHCPDPLNMRPSTRVHGYICF